MNSETIVLLLFSILYTGMVFYIISPLITGDFNNEDNKKDISYKSAAIQNSTIRNLIYELEIDYELGLVDNNDYKDNLAHLNNALEESNK